MAVGAALADDRQRVDLDEVGVVRAHRRHEALRDLDEVAQVGPAEADREGQLAGLVVEEPEERVGGDAVDRLRGRLRHLLDLDAALGRGHEHDPPAGPVQDRAEVELLDDHRGRARRGPCGR